jgi:hypothetical protein
MCVSTETGGSATGLSATDAWHGAAVGDDAYVRLISAVARLSFRQKAQNVDSTNGRRYPRKKKSKTPSCRLDGTRPRRCKIEVNPARRVRKITLSTSPVPTPSEVHHRHRLFASRRLRGASAPAFKEERVSELNVQKYGGGSFNEGLCDASRSPSTPAPCAH